MPHPMGCGNTSVGGDKQNCIWEFRPGLIVTGPLHPWELLSSSLCLQPSSASFCCQTWIIFNRNFFSLQITKYSSKFIPRTTSESKSLTVLSLCQVFTPLTLSTSLTSPFHWLQQAFYLLVMISDAAWTVTSVIGEFLLCRLPFVCTWHIPCAPWSIDQVTKKHWPLTGNRDEK